MISNGYYPFDKNLLKVHQSSGDLLIGCVVTKESSCGDQLASLITIYFDDI